MKETIARVIYENHSIVRKIVMVNIIGNIAIIIKMLFLSMTSSYDVAFALIGFAFMITLGLTKKEVNAIAKADYEKKLHKLEANRKKLERAKEYNKKKFEEAERAYGIAKDNYDSTVKDFRAKYYDGTNLHLTKEQQRSNIEEAVKKMKQHKCETNNEKDN